MGDAVPLRYAAMLEEDLNVGARTIRRRFVGVSLPLSSAYARSTSTIIVRRHVRSARGDLAAACQQPLYGDRGRTTPSAVAAPGTKTLIRACGVERQKASSARYSFEPNSKWIYATFAKRLKVRAPTRNRVPPSIRFSPNIRFNTTVTRSELGHYPHAPHGG